MKCPGQDMQYWKPGDIFEVDCPHCGKKVEFFKDEATRRCANCKNKVVNPRMNFGCAAYCQFAEQCLGDLGPEVLAKRNDLLKDRVALEVKRELGRDFKKLAHALKVARHVEEITGEEKTDPAIVLCAAYLHVFSESGDEKDGGHTEKARSVLERLGAGDELIGKALDIIGRLVTGNVADSQAAKILYDAHLLSLREETEGNLHVSPEEAFFTDAGKRLGASRTKP